MKIDFLSNSFKESDRTDTTFGICDDQNGEKAYSDSTNSTNWIATVNNPHAIAITFTPIDKCLIKDTELPGVGRCDGMLTSNQHLFFIELKDQRTDWISDAVKQLEDTVILFNQNHTEEERRQFKHKKAFACNKARRRFQEIDHEQNLRFFRQYGVRLDIQAQIIIAE